jgi:mannose-6-phosphate isomerase-like protein (cupin superfamily)
MAIFDEGNLASDKLKLWIKYTKGISNWQDLVIGMASKDTGCGLVYELENPIDVNSPDDDFAIADMRSLSEDPGYSEPHYHPGITNEYPRGVIEIYIVLSGRAKCIVGYNDYDIGVGDVVVIPPMTTHYVRPNKEFVIAVISRPPFKPESYIAINKTNMKVKFDSENFAKTIKNEPNL